MFTNSFKINHPSSLKLYKNKRFDLNPVKNFLIDKADEIKTLSDTSLCANYIVNKLHSEMEEMFEKTLLPKPYPIFTESDQLITEYDQYFQRYLSETQIPQDR